MKRFGLFLIFLVLFAVACGSNSSQLGEQTEYEGPATEATLPVETSEATDEPAVEPVDESGAVSPVEDPTQARERDWKLGNQVDPVVTIIEYGDFQ